MKTNGNEKCQDNFVEKIRFNKNNYNPIKSGLYFIFRNNK